MSIQHSILAVSSVPKDTFAQQASRWVGATLLIAGTSIGAGMLGLPAVTANVGYKLSNLLLILGWLLSLGCALILVEATMFFKEDLNFVSLTKRAFGIKASYVSWVVYGSYLCIILAAYLAAESNIFIGIVANSTWSTLLISVMCTGIFILNIREIDRLNRFLVLMLCISFTLICSKSFSHIDVQLYTSPSNFNHINHVFPVIWTAFAFHGIIPSLKALLKGKQKQIVSAILIGSAIPLFVYLLWQSIIFGIIPTTGKQGLIEISQQGQYVTTLLTIIESTVNNSHISQFFKYFGFAAVSSSLLGTALALFDFLADGLHIRKNLKGRATLAVMTFLVPTLITLLFPDQFIALLRHGGIIAAILYVLLPCFMVWQLRYRKSFRSTFTFIGGKITLLILSSIGIFLIGIQYYKQS